jgi:predicted RNA polymerase sigma factor
MTPDDEERWESIGVEAQRLARAGRLAEAEALALSIPDAEELTGYLHEKVAALTELGRALFAAGRPDRGTEVLKQAESLAHRLAKGGAWHEAYALFDIACVWRDFGNTSETLRLWDASVEAAVRGFDAARLLARLAREFRDLGLHEKAAAVVALLPPGYPWQVPPKNTALGE